MPTHKADLSQICINQLVSLTGMTSRTLKKRLKNLDPEDEDGKTLYYNSREALELVYGQWDAINPGDETGIPNIRVESAKNLKLKNQHLEFDLNVKKGQYVPRDDVQKMWSDRIVAFKSRLRILAVSICEELSTAGGSQKIEAILNERHDEVLSELAENADETSSEGDDDEGFEEAGAASETDDL